MDMRCCVSFFFFFSSRRRHTRFDCDWSSDVCSSDLSARRRTRRPTSRAQEQLDGSCSEHGGPSAFSQDRKSTRLNSSHSQISYAVFCLKKKKKKRNTSSHPSIKRDIARPSPLPHKCT